MGSCAAPSAKGDDKFITTDYLQQCPGNRLSKFLRMETHPSPAKASLYDNLPEGGHLPDGA
ncbi:hypothetical protein, partial [Klebsiella michiganensis]|uniref:hypothetical protein n=1 Tax=Klebsiella michiganensis TaxID=1134687 RepID=UPI00287D4612